MATFRQISGLLAPDDAKILAGFLQDVNLPVDDIIKRAQALGRMGRKQTFDGAESYKGFGDEEVIKNLETLRDFVRNRDVTRRIANKRYAVGTTPLDLSFPTGRKKIADWGGAQSFGNNLYLPDLEDDIVIFDDELNRLVADKFDPRKFTTYPDQVEEARNAFLDDKRSRINYLFFAKQRALQDMAALDALNKLFGYNDIPRSWVDPV